MSDTESGAFREGYLAGKEEARHEIERLTHELGDAQAWEQHLKSEIERLTQALKEIADDNTFWTKRRDIARRALMVEQERK